VRQDIGGVPQDVRRLTVAVYERAERAGVSRIPRRKYSPTAAITMLNRNGTRQPQTKNLVFRRMEKRDALIDRRDVKFVGNGMARIIGFVFALGHHDLLMMHVLVGDLLEQMMDAV